MTFEIMRIKFPDFRQFPIKAYISGSGKIKHCQRITDNHSQCGIVLWITMSWVYQSDQSINNSPPTPHTHTHKNTRFIVKTGLVKL